MARCIGQRLGATSHALHLELPLFTVSRLHAWASLLVYLFVVLGATLVGPTQAKSKLWRWKPEAVQCFVFLLSSTPHDPELK